MGVSGAEPGADAGFAAGEEAVVGYQLGIDVGTTYTAAAVCRSSDHRWVEPETVTLGTRSATVPSVIFVAPDGSVVVGEAAERRALTDPDRVVREFKRRIGDPTPIIVGGRAWAPEELSARLVRWVVDRVAEREGGPASRIALTHPASWGGHKKELLVAALAGQGLTVSFLAEPQAAALHYATEERVPPGSTIAVYDLGGGTFDAAVVRKADPGDAAYGAAGFGLLGRPEGLDHLGGVDFDEVVFDHVRDGLPDAFADLDEGDAAVLSAVARVRRECTEAKEALSADTEVSIPVLLPAARGSVRLHRSEFEGLIREQVEETVEALRRAVLSAGCAPEALTAVLLVGGSSRIPMVAQLVSDGLGRPVAVDTDPKNAIAKGAALAVSPKPTASWPEVAIPPVPAAAGSAGAAASGIAADRPGASAAVAPARSGAPVGVGAGMAGMAGMAPAAGAHSRALAGGEAGRADRGRPVLSREPGRVLPSGPGAAPPQRPGVHSGPSFEAGEREAVTSPRRPVALLVGIGGLLAVAAIVLAAMLIPKLTTTSSPGIVTDSGTGSATAATTAPAASRAPVAPGPAPGGAVVNPGPTEHGGPVPGPRSSEGGPGNAPSNNAPAPVPAPPPAAAPTTVPVPSSAPAPTSAAPTPTGSPTTVAQGSSSTAPAPGGATPVNTGSSGGTGSTDGVTPVGTGSSGGVTPVGTGSSGGVTPVSTGTGGGATPAGTGSGVTGSGGTGSGGKVTPVSTGTGSDAGRATAEAAAPAPTVSA